MQDRERQERRSIPGHHVSPPLESHPIHSRAMLKIGVLLRIESPLGVGHGILRLVRGSEIGDHGSAEPSIKGKQFGGLFRHFAENR